MITDFPNLTTDVSFGQINWKYILEFLKLIYDYICGYLERNDTYMYSCTIHIQYCVFYFVFSYKTSRERFGLQNLYGEGSTAA